MHWVLCTLIFTGPRIYWAPCSPLPQYPGCSGPFELLHPNCNSNTQTLQNSELLHFTPNQGLSPHFTLCVLVEDLSVSPMCFHPPAFPLAPSKAHRCFQGNGHRRNPTPRSLPGRADLARPGPLPLTAKSCSSGLSELWFLSVLAARAMFARDPESWTPRKADTSHS